jgi:hypothetical protein
MVLVVPATTEMVLRTSLPMLPPKLSMVFNTRCTSSSSKGMKKVCTTLCARARAGASRARAVTNIRGRIRMEQADIMVTLIPEAESF